ncbi:hypothetical protein ACSHT2_27740 [Bradyrhizobium sp. PUT101]
MDLILSLTMAMLAIDILDSALRDTCQELNAKMENSDRGLVSDW